VYDPLSDRIFGLIHSRYVHPLHIGDILQGIALLPEELVDLFSVLDAPVSAQLRLLLVLGPLLCHGRVLPAPIHLPHLSLTCLIVKDVLSDHVGVAPSDLGQKLDGLVRLEQLLSQHSVLRLQLLYQPIPRILIPHWLVRDVRGSGGVLEGADIFVDVGVTRVQAGHHEAVRVPSQALLEQACQLRISIRHILLGIDLRRACLFVVSEGSDHLPQGEERLVDLDGFFAVQGTLVACESSPFRASQVHHLELADDHVIASISEVYLLHCEGQDAVGPAGAVVHVVGSHHLVLDPKVVQGQHVLWAFALECVQILD